MRVLVLHSDVPADAPPDEQDTLVSAAAIEKALNGLGHTASRAAFAIEPERFSAMLEAARPDVVFNLVESVFGLDSLACAAPALLERYGIPFTGSGAAAIALAADKPMTKRLLRSLGLPTPDWAEPPDWPGLDDGRSYIVKSATEDASIGLDDGAIVRGRAAVLARAEEGRARRGGRWFAEAYVEGREFNVALIEEGRGFRVLPIPEIRFEDWPAQRPRIVGYRAKWDETSEESVKTPRSFGLEESDGELAASLASLAREACRALGVCGYVRVDFRTDAQGAPLILEVNPNPCLEPGAGFSAAAREAGLSYVDLVALVLDRTLRA